MPTTSIPTSVYTMQNYMASLNQLSSGAITITAAKPKEKECIDLTEDDDCVVMPTPSAEAPTLTSHLLSTNQVFRHRNQIPQNNVKTSFRNYRPPYGTLNVNTSNISNSTTMTRKNQISTSSSFLNTMGNTNSTVTSNSLINAPAPSIIRIPMNGQTSVQILNKRKPVKSNLHPAPLPYTPPPLLKPEWKKPPPRPSIKIDNATNGIVISWTMEETEDSFAECTQYQIYAYQQTCAMPQTDFWKHVGDVKAMLLPMAVTLTQFQEGHRYFFAVRAMDMYKRYGPFSLPRTWC